MATGFLMRHCTVSLRCMAQYRQVDIYTTPMRSASPLAPPGLHGNRLLMRHCAFRFTARRNIDKSILYHPYAQRLATGPVGAAWQPAFDAPLRRFASLHGAISTSRYYTTPMRSASPLAPPGLHGNRLLMRPCAVSLRCMAQYRQVDIIPPPMRSASPLAPPGLHGNRLLMCHCTVSLPRGGLKIPFYAILKRSFSRL